MNDQPDASSFTLEPADNQRLANLCGPFNEHLRHIERRLGVEINNRGADFNVIGDPRPVRAAEEVLKGLYAETAREKLSGKRVHLFLQEAGVDALLDQSAQDDGAEVVIQTRHGQVKGRGPNQRRYLRNVLSHDISFGIGPAGTGKTYLAVACAVEALEKQKVDPYLRPLYDALYEMLGFERVDKFIERNIIEVAPLAYMRGRSLNESFIILDEAQNTTIEQMKMFLTRIGFGSTAVITGDVTQVDLPHSTPSGLRHVIEVLKDVDGISFTFFQAKDVVRHPLVQRIVTAYDKYEAP